MEEGEGRKVRSERNGLFLGKDTFPCREEQKGRLLTQTMASFEDGGPCGMLPGTHQKIADRLGPHFGGEVNNAMRLILSSLLGN